MPDNRQRLKKFKGFKFLREFSPSRHTLMATPFILFSEPGLSIDNGRVFHVLWRTIVWPLDVSRELFLDGQSFSRHTVSGALAVLWP